MQTTISDPGFKLFMGEGTGYYDCYEDLMGKRLIKFSTFLMEKP